MNKITLALALTVLTQLPRVTLAQEAPAPEQAAPEQPAGSVEANPGTGARSRYVLSARGPGDGKHAFGALVTFFGIAPAVDARWVFGINETLTFEMRAERAFIYGVSRFDVGLRYAFVESESFSLAAQGSLQALAVELPDSLGAGVGVNPKVLASFGTEDAQFTIGVEAPLHFLDTGAGFGFFPGLVQVEGGVELAAITGASVTLQAGAMMVISNGDVSALPILSVGGSL